MGNIADAGDLAGINHSPFGGTKVAQQFTQLAIDPSQGLTRKRYGWFSNGTRFDDSLFSEVEAGIRIETTATGSDDARLLSAYPGQYVSQSFAQPGLGFVIDDGDVSLSNGEASLGHGEVYAGAFYWDTSNDVPDTGLGYKWDSSGWEFFVRSNGSHIGPSPVAQADFGVRPGNGTGGSGTVIDPGDGYVFNFPHTWYNEGPLSGAFLNTSSNRVEEMVRVAVEGRPSTDTANLPVQIVVRNAGTAEKLGVEVGGMQYTTYGAGRDDLQRRRTDEGRKETAGYITDQVATTENAPDPTSTSGKPLVAGQRESGREDLNLRTTALDVKPQDDDIYVFAWDEYDAGSALSGTNQAFTDPVSPNNAGKESHIKTDTQATGYSPSTAVFRGWELFEGGSKNKADLQDTDIDIRVPLDATRVFTAVNSSGTNADVNPFKVRFEEGY